MASVSAYRVFVRREIRHAPFAILDQEPALAANIPRCYGQTAAQTVLAAHLGAVLRRARAQLSIKVLKIINESYAQARALLLQHRGQLDVLCCALLERETLDEKEIRALIALPTTPGAAGERPVGTAHAVAVDS
jgi:hypothetical protein